MTICRAPGLERRDGSGNPKQALLDSLFAPPGEIRRLRPDTRALVTTRHRL